MSLALIAATDISAMISWRSMAYVIIELHLRNTYDDPAGH